jgi:hypothetical protein
MSPSVVAGLGSTIVTLFKAPFSSFVLFSVVCLTARNTYLRVIRESEESTGKGDNTHEAPSRIGLKGFLQEVATSSGLFSTVQGITYLATGLSFFGRDLYLSSTFIIFSFGSLAIARACNLEDRPPKREPLLLEQGLREIGANLPERLKSVLLNPGVFFPIGNLMLIFRDTPFSIFDAPVQMAIFCAGIAVSGAGLVRGLAPLITDRLNLNSGFASTASGIGDILMGATSFSANLNETGLATVLWGISNVLAGLKVSIGKVPESAPNHKQRQEEGEN